MQSWDTLFALHLPGVTYSHEVDWHSLKGCPDNNKFWTRNKFGEWALNSALFPRCIDIKELEEHLQEQGHITSLADLHWTTIHWYWLQEYTGECKCKA